MNDFMKKNVLKIGIITVICVLSLSLLVVYVIPTVYVAFNATPPLKYSINKRKGLYPSEKELGSSVWVNEYQTIKLTIFHNSIYGEISTDEITYFVRGYFFYGTVGFLQTRIDEKNKSYEDVTLCEGDYEYHNGKIEVSNVKIYADDFTIDKDFVLQKQKSLNESQVQTYQCEEMNMFLKIHEETNVHACGTHNVLNNLKIEFEKKSNKYYFLKLSIDKHEYILVGILKNENNRFVFDIVFIRCYDKHTLVKDTDIYEGPLADYLPKDLKILTFKV